MNKQANPFLEIRGLFKTLGKRNALQNFDLQLFPGEVVGLADRTGTAKSALIQILSGTLPPDEGLIKINGQRLSYPWIPENHALSIGYQDPILADFLDVISNIFLGNEICYPLLGRVIRIPNQSKMAFRAREILDSLDFQPPSLHEQVMNLSEQQRQLIALAQILAREPKAVVLDDVDAVLNLPYQEKLLELIQNWQVMNTAVLFSSKNLDHLFAVSDRIMVLREGKVVANVRTDETDRLEIVTALIGGTGNRQQRTPVIWAFDSYYRARKQAETLHHNQMLLEKDLAAQDSLNRQLVNQLAKQVQALDSANLALQDAQRRLLTEREEERKHLARELHDQMIQDLLSLNYQLEDIIEKAHDLPPLESDTKEVQQDIRHMVEDLRRICGDLRPPTIDSFGLDAAIQSHSRNWSERTGIEIRLQMSESLGRLPEALELSIFRIVQEGLNNIWKHAEATKATVSVQSTSPRMLLITIEDDGMGLEEPFDLAQLGQNQHYGLLGISERVALMNGRLNIQNKPQGGLLIQAEIPHPRIEPSSHE
ncbi:MAG: ATP-binding cassette domain-containing protein [Chloroflexota bacterium]